MKVITFLRHSKSSWENDLEDINRPLSQTGIEKIKKVAKALKKASALHKKQSKVIEKHIKEMKSYGRAKKGNR